MALKIFASCAGKFFFFFWGGEPLSSPPPHPPSPSAHACLSLAKYFNSLLLNIQLNIKKTFFKDSKTKKNSLNYLQKCFLLIYESLFQFSTIGWFGWKVVSRGAHWGSSFSPRDQVQGWGEHPCIRRASPRRQHLSVQTIYDEKKAYFFTYTVLKHY